MKSSVIKGIDGLMFKIIKTSGGFQTKEEQQEFVRVIKRTPDRNHAIVNGVKIEWKKYSQSEDVSYEVAQDHFNNGGIVMCLNYTTGKTTFLDQETICNFFEIKRAHFYGSVRNLTVNKTHFRILTPE